MPSPNKTPTPTPQPPTQKISHGFLSPITMTRLRSIYGPPFGFVGHQFYLCVGLTTACQMQISLLSMKNVRMAVRNELAQNSQVILGAALLVVTRSVRPRLSSGRSTYWLLRKHRCSVPLLLMISLPSLTVSHFVKPACAGVSHCWRFTAHSTMG
jgi:hypothetical protein